MFSTRRTLAWASTFCACAVMAAGCSGTPTSSGAGAQPVRGGTLRIIGSSDVDHLDSASAYYTASLALERTFTRQLVSYPASADTSFSTNRSLSNMDTSWTVWRGAARRAVHRARNLAVDLAYAALDPRVRPS